MNRQQPVVLYITDESDPAVEPVGQALSELGVSTRLLERNNYGKTWSLSWISTGRGIRCVLEHDDGDLLADSAVSAYVRREFSGPLLNVGLDVDEHGYMDLQQAIHVNSVYRWLGTQIPFMNEPMANLRMMSKMVQQSIALECGFDLPQTFVGSSPEVAREFQSSVSGDLCIKPIEATKMRLEDGSQAVHLTRRFQRRSRADLESLRSCPVVLQKFVEKRDELRVLVVGEEVLACRIDTSTASPEAQIDFRHYDWANTPHEAIPLDDALCARLREFMRRASLTYGAFDLIRSTDERTVFLEVNPMGQWLWVEDLTGLPVTSAIARWLTNPATA